MEKVLLEVLVNDIPADCIMTLSEKITKDGNGLHIWHDREKNLVEAKKFPWRIELYVKETNGQHKKINISPQSIKKIHEEILRIESTDCITELD